MNEKQYQELCQACDEILLSPDANIKTVAIPWLHVLNEHAENLKKYTGLFGTAGSIQGPGFSRFIINTGRALLGILKSRAVPREHIGKRSVIFVSHLLNKKQVGDPTDFYFGDLSSELVKLQIPNLVLLMNHTGMESKKLVASWDVSGGERAFFPEQLNFRTELKISIGLFMESYRLFRKGKKQTDKFKRAVAMRAASEAISPSTIAVLRKFYFIMSLAKETAVKSIVVTFEGHSWERIIFAAARKVNPGICCIGYHHTILFPRQHAALRNLQAQFQPDIILTAGDHTRNHFRTSYPSSVEVITLGIHRVKPTEHAIGEGVVKNGTPTCLVIPDGIISEVLYMFRFVAEAALALPEINFILRLHPVIPKESFLAAYPEFAKIPANVSFSVNDIQNDFDLSGWALYRGSNSAIYATISGLRPIYLCRENELEIDCLFELRTWKKMVSAVNDLVQVVKNDLLEKDPEKRKAEAKDAIENARKYFMPVDNDVFMATGIKNN